MKDYKSTRIRKAFEEYARKNQKQNKYAVEINRGVAEILGEPLNGWCASDFAEPETTHKRSKLNKTLFMRYCKGFYYVIPTNYR